MFEFSRVHDISVLHLYGELSLLEMEMLGKTIHSLKKHRYYKILLDLSGVDHVHYQVMHALARQAMALKEKRGGLKLAHVSDEMQKILKFTGADQVLEDYATLSEAILSFLRRQNGDSMIGNFLGGRSRDDDAPKGKGILPGEEMLI